jgi:hypothetical protein
MSSLLSIDFMYNDIYAGYMRGNKSKVFKSPQFFAAVLHWFHSFGRRSGLRI